MNWFLTKLISRLAVIDWCIFPATLYAFCLSRVVIPYVSVVFVWFFDKKKCFTFIVMHFALIAFRNEMYHIFFVLKKCPLERQSSYSRSKPRSLLQGTPPAKRIHLGALWSRKVSSSCVAFHFEVASNVRVLSIRWISY